MGIKLSDITQSRDNNYNLIRFLVAIAVMYNHTLNNGNKCFFIIFFITLILSVLSWHLIENRMLDLKDKYYILQDKYRLLHRRYNG